MLAALSERIRRSYTVAAKPSKKMKMLPDTQRLLAEIYSPHNRRLRELLEMSSNPQHRHALVGEGADWIRRPGD